MNEVIESNKSRDSNRNNTSVTVKQYHKRCQKSFESDQDKAKDNKTPKKNIAFIGDSMINT